MNELRRLARKEITRLKDHISSIQENASKAADDIAKLKGSQSDLKLQLQHLKEDNLRKTKLIASIKAAKNADSNALEQWKAEGKNMEENIKRFATKQLSSD